MLVNLVGSQLVNGEGVKDNGKCFFNFEVYNIYFLF